MAERLMANPTEALLQQLLQAALDHGLEEGSDIEARDLHEMLRAARGAPEYRAARGLRRAAKDHAAEENT
jgi:hypothetical protein